MTDSKPDKKKEARDRALEAGEIPLDPYPGYLTWFFRAFVDREYRESELDALCWMFRHREAEILDTWCGLARKDPWAWDEARRKLEDLVARGREVPVPLAKFALVARPVATSGSGPERARDIRQELFARVMEQEGFERHEINQQFDRSFPSTGRKRKDPGSTHRYRRSKGRPFVAPPFALKGRTECGLAEELRPVSLEYDWAAPGEAARVLLTSGWPALALIWELWPECREERVAKWCDEARSDSWLWGELWALIDHAVYCGWHRPVALGRFAAHPRRPAQVDPRNKEGLRVRLAAVAHHLQEKGQSQHIARRCCIDGLGESAAALDPSTHSRRFKSGRERLERLISLEIG